MPAEAEQRMPTAVSTYGPPAKTDAFESMSGWQSPDTVMPAAWPDSTRRLVPCAAIDGLLLISGSPPAQADSWMATTCWVPEALIVFSLITVPLASPATRMALMLLALPMPPVTEISLAKIAESGEAYKDTPVADPDPVVSTLNELRATTTRDPTLCTPITPLAEDWTSTTLSRIARSLPSSTSTPTARNSPEEPPSVSSLSSAPRAPRTDTAAASVSARRSTANRAKTVGLCTSEPNTMPAAVAGNSVVVMASHRVHPVDSNEPYTEMPSRIDRSAPAGPG
jgi:hypothetical protein